MRRLFLLLAWLGAVATLVGFFLPWARIDVHEPSALKHLRAATPLDGTVGDLTKDLGRIAVTIRRGTETITGELPSLSNLPKQVSGVQIPQLANQDQAQVAMALVELFTHQRQHVGLKSYLVYVVPGLAFACVLLLTGLSRRPAIAMGVGLVCALVAAIGFWKLLTTNTTTLMVAVTIGQGLWLSLWGYVGLAIAAACLNLQRGPRT